MKVYPIPEQIEEHFEKHPQKSLDMIMTCYGNVYVRLIPDNIPNWDEAVEEARKISTRNTNMARWFRNLADLSLWRRLVWAFRAKKVMRRLEDES